MRYRSGDLFGYAVLTFSLHLNGRVEGGGGVCKDLQGHTFGSGYYYIPEPCTLCVCDNGNPKWCKAVICRLSQKSVPKQDCKSFRIGTPCCEFICLDDTLSSVTNDKADGIEGNSGESSATYDLGLKLVASCITAILSLSLLFFLIHRLRQRKIRVCVAGRQSRQLAEEQRALGSMGYLERGGLPHGVQLDDMACSGGYPLWKPPGNYFPRGEAPPPYEEAVAAARAEQALLTISPHALSPLNFPNSYLTSHTSHSNMALMPTAQNNLQPNSPTAPNYNVASPSSSISSATRPLNSASSHTSTCHQQLNHTDENASTGFYTGSSIMNFNVGTNIYENTTPVSASITNNPTPEHSSVHSSTHSDNYPDNRRHITLPRQGSAFTISATLPNASSISTHRTIPRTLATSNNLRLRRDLVAHQSVAPLINPMPNEFKSPEHSPRYASSTATSNETAVQTAGAYDYQPPSTQSRHTNTQPQVEAVDSSNAATNNDETVPLTAPTPRVNQDGSFDSVTCTCSMQALPTLHDDADDYRSECENCKSATGSRYYLDNEDELVTSPHETMTLHRRPEETATSIPPQYYRTSLTLPTNTRQRTRSTSGRGNWFSSMPESSTESSDDD
ncbi:hypothetical protein PV327_003965 [Microctonus hyperodae]|uniref:Integral membrane protein DGCR2/IDD n=1 Tax=Microctonus hyperodae TaxID=165561 RepID=A0AA39G545_MICHY|nr:hypothetical protein PV327_003965 [Microctonus hyperodae]